MHRDKGASPARDGTLPEHLLRIPGAKLLHQMSADKSAETILHEVGDHAGTQAAAPVRQQTEQTAIHGDEQHEFPALISVTGAEGDALEYDSAGGRLGQG